ncbi:MAG: hypothetical protein AABY22_05160 [Nanoarchaeota archaeon]
MNKEVETLIQGFRSGIDRGVASLFIIERGLSVYKKDVDIQIVKNLINDELKMSESETQEYE